MQNRVIAILGCTASGKGELARVLAPALGGEILSVDSMKVYRGMDIGTAKPPAVERAATPHHLIDVADPWESFSAARFVAEADAAVAGMHGRGRICVAVGGTMLYFKAFYHGLLPGPSADAAFREQLRRRAESEGLEALHAELARVDPAAAARIHRNDLRRIERALEVYHLTGRPISGQQTQWDGGSPGTEDARLDTRDSPFSPGPRRPDWQWLLLALRRPREAASRRINERVRRMLAAGLVEEARRIWSDPRGVGEQARQAVGYAELFAHFEGRCSLDEAIERIKIHSRRLAKHQRTWMRPMTGLHWIEVGEEETGEQMLPRVLALVQALEPHVARP